LLIAKIVLAKAQNVGNTEVLASFVTQDKAILASTLWDREIFCDYGVNDCLFRMTKPRNHCLVLAKNLLWQCHVWIEDTP
ncbi:MAG: hypothetical protein CR957_00005, partial [Gammaproteobacteria bacterium]